MNKLCFFVRIDQIEVYFVLNKPLISFILFFFLFEERSVPNALMAAEKARSGSAFATL